jgi:hypothetical protein
VTEQARVVWGGRVAQEGLPELYAPQEVEPFAVPPGGIDNLGLHSTDVFTIPNRGEFTVKFSGYFRVARANPTTPDWTTSEVWVNIVDLNMVGNHEEIGQIRARLNPDIVSSGQIFPTVGPGQPKACRIATAVAFEIDQLGTTVYNREPILLMNDHVTQIPPVDDPSGRALLFLLPLYDRADPTAEPAAYLTSLRYGADNYLTEAEVRSFQTQ